MDLKEFLEKYNEDDSLEDRFNDVGVIVALDLEYDMMFLIFKEDFHDIEITETVIMDKYKDVIGVIDEGYWKLASDSFPEYKDINNRGAEYAYKTVKEMLLSIDIWTDEFKLWITLQ